MQTGRFLISTKALACVNCHTLHGKQLSATKPDPTTRAPELTRLAAHLRSDYFARWIRNPARIRPGTKMPQVIRPDGRVPISSLASLPPGAALNALWTYLNEGPDAQPPAEDATVQARPTLDNPVVQRGEIEGGGVRCPRGLAAGFVDGTLLFDADQLCLVASWYDGFLTGGVGNYFGPTWSVESKETERLLVQPHALSFQAADGAPWQDFALPLASDPNVGTRFEGYQVGKSSVRIHYRILLGDRLIHVQEDLLLRKAAPWQGFARQWHIRGLAPGMRVALRTEGNSPQWLTPQGTPAGDKAGLVASVRTAPLVLCEANGKSFVYRVAATEGMTWENDSAAGLRLISPPAGADAPIRLRVDRWTWTKGDRPQAADLAGLEPQAPAFDDDFDSPLRPPATEAARDPLAASTSANSDIKGAEARRPPVSPRMNVDEFPPVRGKFLRFTVSAVEGNTEPGIDEIEVFGADAEKNLGPTGKATASSVIPGFDKHQIAHINDGQVGNDHSWISHEQAKGWAQIEFPEPIVIRKVVWARDRTGACVDRLATGYQIAVSDDGNQWTTVSDSSDRKPLPAQSNIVAEASPGYRMESMPVPFAGCRPSDIAFSDDGWMFAIAMTEGQIWRTERPPEGEPAAVHWRRIAAGLYHPIGLQIIDGRMFVAQKPEVTELIDRDGDGVIDQYRTVASGWGLSTGYHEYTFGLAVDRQKNLWVALNTGYFWTHPGHVNPGRWRGSILKINYEADRMEVVAKGCRVPDGIARGPNGDIFYTDNQGDWIQSCKLAAVVPGRFYGHPEYKEDALPDGTYPDGRVAVWMPYNLSRSTSGPVHDETGNKFGPFADQMFVGDVGYGANPGIMRVALEKVDGEYQGACFRFVDNQPHGCVRMKFGPDQQLYMASLTTGLTRMKFVGPTPLAIHDLKIRAGGQGFEVRLTKPLAAETKLDSTAINVQRYHYIYSGNYGSPDADRAKVNVTAAELSPDRQTIVLSLPVETYPIGMVYEFDLGRLEGEDHQPLVHNQAWYTVHRIPQ